MSSPRTGYDGPVCIVLWKEAVLGREPSGERGSFDFKEADPIVRRGAVEGSLRRDPRPTRAQMSAMADYMLFVSDPGSTLRERSEEYPVLTRNREATIARREVGAGALAPRGGADQPSVEEALSSLGRNVPSTGVGGARPPAPSDWRMADNEEAVASLLAQADRAGGKRRFELRRQVIAKYRERSAIAESAAPAIPSVSRSLVPPDSPVGVEDEVVVDPGTLMPGGRRGLTMCDVPCVRALMRDYPALKALCEGDARSDVAAMLVDLEGGLASACAGDPVLSEFASLMLGGRTVASAAREMGEAGVHRSEQYWAAQWGQRLPRAVADGARRRWLLRNWGKRKVCTMCGRELPAHPLWFTRNTSRDGYYSRCKECRTRVRREGAAGR